MSRNDRRISTVAACWLLDSCALHHRVEVFDRLLQPTLARSARSGTARRALRSTAAAPVVGLGDSGQLSGEAHRRLGLVWLLLTAQAQLWRR